MKRATFLRNTIVSNTGPLISFERFPDGFQLARKLYGKILIPRQVMNELYTYQFPSAEAYLMFYGIENFIEIKDISASTDLITVPPFSDLDEGEKWAIELAYALSLPLLIEDLMSERHWLNEPIWVAGYVFCFSGSALFSFHPTDIRCLSIMDFNAHQIIFYLYRMITRFNLFFNIFFCIVIAQPLYARVM